MSKKLTTEEFIRRAKEIHGDKYDYSKVEYVNCETKVCIICPEHGEFRIRPTKHLSGKGCQQCVHRSYKYTTSEFIEKAREFHGDKYDYSKVKYVNQSTKVCIICPEHGEFWQFPNNHLNGFGVCPKCSRRERLTTEEFIRKAKEVHGDKYYYNKVKYTNTKTNVCIVCPEHGEFWQNPVSHLRGNGCSICNVGYTKQYKFNLLQEFKNEYEFRAFLENNDSNILYAILSVIEPKYEPLKSDIERALANGSDINPIKALEEKYSSDSDDEDELVAATESAVDLDDDDAVDTVNNQEEQRSEITIDEIISNTEKEIKVITKIEHLLTPEVRKYIMDKFLNDKRREWMLKREESVK